MTRNTTTENKLRAIGLAVLMVFSVFGGAVAVSGTAAAGNAPDAGSYSSGTIPGTDNTPTAFAAPDRPAEIADIDFETPGNVSYVDVGIDQGSDSLGGIESGDVSEINVSLYHNNGELLASQVQTYNENEENVSFVGTATDGGDNVAAITVTAEIASDASDGAVIDAGIEVKGEDTSGTLQSFGGNSPYDTVGTQEIDNSDTFVTASVSSPTQGSVSGATVEIIKVSTGTVVATKTTDSNGNIPSVQVAQGNKYTATARKGGFTTSSSATKAANPGTTNLPITLTAVGIPKTVEVIHTVPTDQQQPADDTSDIVYYVQVRGQLGNVDGEPLNDKVVDLNINDSSGTLDIEPDGPSPPPGQNTTEELTLPNGTTVNGTTMFRVDSGDVQSAVLNFSSNQNQSAFTMAPANFGVLSGEGTVQGQVVAEDTTGGLEDAQVWAVDYNRFTGNAATPTFDVGSGDTDYFRVVNESTGDVVDADNYRIALDEAPANSATGKVEFLNESNKGVGSGFFITDRGITDGEVPFYIVPLEPDSDDGEDYQVQVSETAPNATRQASPQTAPAESFVDAVDTVGNDAQFGATENLTYADAENNSEPYDEGGPVLADLTDEDGDYVLSKLYTNFQQGKQYVVISQKAGYSTDFVDAGVTERGFDIGTIGPFVSTAPEEFGEDENLNLKPREVTPIVDVQNVGFAEGLTDNDQLQNFQEFNNQTDAFLQTIVRDGSYIDVVNVTATAESSGQPVDATVTLEVEDDIDVNGADDSPDSNATNIAGEWVEVAGGTIVNSTQDTITIEVGADGQAQAWFQADRSVQSYDPGDGGPANITATAENNADEPDRTAKQIVGITQFGSISGFVTDEANNGISESEVYVDEFDLNTQFLSGSAPFNTAVDLEPIDSNNDNEPENYRINIINGTSAVIASETVPRSELVSGYGFEDFSTSVRVRFGLVPPEPSGFTLVTETRTDGTYTLPRVPAKGTSAQFQNAFNVRSLTDKGNVGAAQAFPGVSSTDDANIVIPEAGAQLGVSDLNPQNVTVTQGDVIDVSANVSNTGTATVTRDVQFRVNDSVIATQTVTVPGGETVPVTFNNIDTASLSNGTYTHGVYVLNSGNVDTSATATLTVESDNGTDGQVTTDDIITAIVEYNSGSDDVTTDDIISMIVQYNSQN
ncbi:surface glycoprotein [Halorientalis persicus]|uniref:Surface glycoprotein n=1 Tax=Halorientalis persicus TaxID=1367881 RepID=A0A1H8WMX4_9EURY|nr:surface glycoprotein [Halorientalis persicus]SEP28959.1 surface glycoprotein [Halorientalis persicus]